MSKGNLYWKDIDTGECDPVICEICRKGHLSKHGMTVTCPNEECELNKKSPHDRRESRIHD